MAHAILACTLLLALGASASPFSETEAKYIQDLETNVARIPAILNGVEGAPKINVEPFDRLSEAAVALRIDDFKGTFDFTTYDGVDNIRAFAKYAWVRFDYIRYYLTLINYDPKNSSAADLIESAKESGVLTKFTETELQNNYIYFNNYLDNTLETYKNIPMCTTQQSRQQVIHHFYKMIVLSDLMASVTRAIFVELNEIPRATDSSQSELQKFLARQNISYGKIKNAMEKATRSIYACDPRSSDFASIDKAIAILDIFKVGLYNPSNPYVGEGEDALTPCWKYGIQNKNYNNDNLESGAIAKFNFSLTFCDGPARRIPFEYSNSRSAVIKETIVTEYSNSRSAVEAIVTEDLESRLCGDEPQRSHVCVSDLSVYVTNNNKTDRYVHLSEAISDSGDNKVITGVKFGKEGNFFYIQIQQGKLGPRDTIVPNTIEWKVNQNNITDIDSYAKAHRKYQFPEVNHDFHTFHKKLYYGLHVGLDDITPPKNSKKRYALTGLRFVEDDGSLKLEIETKPYNYETGILKGRNEWRGNNTPVKSRQELKLEDPTAPLNYKHQYEFSKPGTTVQFQETTLKKSLKVGTVPYIDTQEIVTQPPSPLAGAGIFVKGTKGSGGYLSLKLIAHDYAPNF